VSEPKFAVRGHLSFSNVCDDQQIYRRTGHRHTRVSRRLEIGRKTFPGVGRYSAVEAIVLVVIDTIWGPFSLSR